MNNVLVTGSKGQLGSEIHAIESLYPELNFMFTDVEELDLTNFKAVADFFDNNNIATCINCAAYTAVDKAEDDRELSLLINYVAVENLAKICQINNSLLIHVSTDYVFSGNNFKPYAESDKVAPNSHYGLTKLKGEEAVLNNCNRAVIIRTSWLYSIYGNNFVSTMIRLGKERDELGVVVDQIGTPTHAADLAKAILAVVEKVGSDYIKEVYHYSNEGVISWYDFAKAIMENKNIDCRVVAIESKDFPAKAARPFYSVLNKAKIKTDFQVDVPYWLDSLRTMLSNLDN